MQHYPMKIERNRPYVVAIISCPAAGERGYMDWTPVKVSPPLDEDVVDSREVILVKGNQLGRSGLMVVRWVGYRYRGYRIWEEVTPDNE